MSEEDKVFREILKELVATNQNIEVRLNKFNKNQLEAFKEISNQNLEQNAILQQMAKYLKNPQTIADYVTNDYTKQNERTMRQLADQFRKTCLLFNPEIIGMSRLNTKIISSTSDPVYINQNTSLANPIYTVNTTDLIKYAENAYIQVYNTAYYRVGYLPTIGTSFVPVNDNSAAVALTEYNTGSALSLSVKSSSGSDTAAGIGVQQVAVSGLDASGNRSTIQVNLNGTNAVTVGTFLQVDAMSAVSTGTNNSAVGNISLYNASTNYGVILIGNNAWRSGRFYTDASAAGYIDAWNFGGSSDTFRAQLRTSAQASSYGSFITRAAVIVQSASSQLAFPVPIRIPQNMVAMVRAIAKTGSGSNETTTSFELHFITE